MIGVSFRTENPFYDDSYVVNSPNLGPYGDAVNDELIPKIDAMFRTIARPYARAVTGGSTGGWITVANQLFRPDLFGSSWSGYPDSLDFNAHQTVDLYNANSAYVEANGDIIPSSHNYNIATGVDTVTLTMPNENHYELAVGNRTRSQVGQWDIWNAAFGAQGANCYPLEPWNKVTGAIDHGAVDKWKGMDMSEVLTKPTGRRSARSCATSCTSGSAPRTRTTSTRASRRSRTRWKGSGARATPRSPTAPASRTATRRTRRRRRC